VRPWARGGGRLVLNYKALAWRSADALARLDAPPAFARPGGGIGPVSGSGSLTQMPAALALPAQVRAACGRATALC
jgi:hypothetical protein